MASRSLQRIEFSNPAVAEKLGQRNITTARDLFMMTEVELMEAIDLPMEDVLELLRAVGATIIPPVSTALQLHNQALTRIGHLPTSLANLDMALRGGLRHGGITEIVGPAGVGKSQLCFMLSVSAAISASRENQNQPGCVFYIDTEKRFSPGRLVEIAQARWPDLYGTLAAVQALTQRVIVINPSSSADLLQRLKAMESSVIDHGVCLIVVDSIAALARTEFDGGQGVDRAQQLGQLASALKYLAETFRIPVVVTNQVTTQMDAKPSHRFDGAAAASSSSGADRDQSYLTAALGTLWAHAINTRLILERSGGHRFIIVAKSASAPQVAFAYDVKKTGLELQLDCQIPHSLQGSLIDMRIANDMVYEPE